jgi:uncharacterized protein YjbI with pentapeptide repeats
MKAEELLSHYKSGRRNFQGIDLQNINLAWVDLSEIDLEGANLQHVNFSAAILKRANFETANLSFADLSRTDLTEANLRGANIEGAVLDGAKFENVSYDDETNFPKGFDLSVAIKASFLAVSPQSDPKSSPKSKILDQLEDITGHDCTEESNVSFKANIQKEILPNLETKTWDSAITQRLNQDLAKARKPKLEAEQAIRDAFWATRDRQQARTNSNDGGDGSTESPYEVDSSFEVKDFVNENNFPESIWSKIEEIDKLSDHNSQRYGRLLNWQNSPDPFWHYGIGLSNTHIFDTGAGLCPFERHDAKAVMGIEHIAFTPDQTIERLKQALCVFENWDYSFLGWNCEHFGRLIATDEPKCYQSSILWWLSGQTPNGQHKTAHSILRDHFNKIAPHLNR